MGEIVLRTIEMTLDPKSIDNAITQLTLFEKHFYEAVRDLCEYLLNTGVEVAKLNLALFGSDRSGALRDSIHRGAFDMSTGRGVITAGEGLHTKYGSYAMFVEFGTGIFNENGGGRETPWVYYDDYFGRFVWTRGQPAKPFMHETLNEMAEIAEKEGGRIIAAYMASKE